MSKPWLTDHLIACALTARELLERRGVLDPTEDMEFDVKLGEAAYEQYRTECEFRVHEQRMTKIKLPSVLPSIRHEGAIYSKIKFMLDESLEPHEISFPKAEDFF